MQPRQAHRRPARGVSVRRTGREPDEWQQGTLPKAVLMSQGDVVARFEEIPKDKPVLCVCRSGGRSSNVAAFLAFNGYEAANLSGGMKALGMQD